MSLSVNVVITGDEELIAKLTKLGSKLTNFKEVLTKTGDQLKDYYQEKPFASMGGVYGTPWAKLSSSTRRYKIKHYAVYAAVPLMRTGAMKHSFEKTATENSLVIKNTAPYFDYHQSSAPRHKLPRRQIMGINKELKSLIKANIEADIHHKIERL